MGAFSKALAIESASDLPRDENGNYVLTHEQLVRYARTVTYKVAHNLANGHPLDRSEDPLQSYCGHDANDKPILRHASVDPSADFIYNKLALLADPEPASPITVPASEQAFEQELVDKGLTAPRLTPNLINSLVKSVDYHHFPGTTTTVCCITLINGDTTTGTSGCVSPENFNAESGQKAAFEQARDKIWEKAGAVLKDALSWDSDNSIIGVLQQDPVIHMALAAADEDEVIFIARVAHEVNRAYCAGLGDDSQVPWSQAPEWQVLSAINGVNMLLNNPNATPEMTHESWLKEKLENGWRYGPVKDAEKKEHPCCVPYGELPIEQRIKDYLFRAVVHACN